MHKLVLLRHGLSEWNIQNWFTGWHNVDLADAGIAESRKVGQALRNTVFQFDIAYTSLLKRSIPNSWNRDSICALYEPSLCTAKQLK
ncbi:histidine phosphatase family protein [Desulfosarcina sp.]|uniref:histidine phosphatase family protein n=1 Tax=Desulfosarcina sp. TaxID=2027861 RepID=UPI0039B9C8B0